MGQGETNAGEVIMKEYYRIEYSEQEEGSEKTTHATCVARNPYMWLECRRQFEKHRPPHEPRIEIIIIGDKIITKDEYDAYHAAEKERMLSGMVG